MKFTNVFPVMSSVTTNSIVRGCAPWWVTASPLSIIIDPGHTGEGSWDMDPCSGMHTSQTGSVQHGETFSREDTIFVYTSSCFRYVEFHKVHSGKHGCLNLVLLYDDYRDWLLHFLSLFPSNFETGKWNCECNKIVSITKLYSLWQSFVKLKHIKNVQIHVKEQKDEKLTM